MKLMYTVWFNGRKEVLDIFIDANPYNLSSSNIWQCQNSKYITHEHGGYDMDKKRVIAKEKDYYVMKLGVSRIQVSYVSIVNDINCCLNCELA
jgi:hypothetical protein